MRVVPLLASLSLVFGGCHPAGHGDGSTITDGGDPEGDLGDGGEAGDGGGPLDGSSVGLTGTVDWSSSYSTAGLEGASTVAIDSQGNFVLAGTFQDPLAFGGTTLTAKGSLNLFIAKIAPDGTLLWARSYGDVEEEGVSDMELDGADNIYLTGRFRTQTDFGGGSLMAIGGSGSFSSYLVRLAPDGSWTATSWSKVYGHDVSTYSLGVQRATGSVAITGSFHGMLQLGATTIAAHGPQDGFAAKLDSSGALQWLVDYTPASLAMVDSSGSGAGIALDAQGDAFVVGSFTGEVQFPTGLRQAGPALQSAFVARLDGQNGDEKWAHVYGGGVGPMMNGFSENTAIGLALDSAGNPIVSGTFSERIDFGGPSPLVTSSSPDAFLVKLTAATGDEVWAKGVGGPLYDVGAILAVDATDHVLFSGTFQQSIDLGGGLRYASASTIGTPSDSFLVKYGGDGAYLWEVQLVGTARDAITGLQADPTSGAIAVAGTFAFGNVTIGANMFATPGNDTDFFLARLDP